MLIGQDNATALSKREGVKNLLAQMLPKFRRQIDKELEEKNRCSYHCTFIYILRCVVCDFKHIL